MWFAIIPCNSNLILTQDYMFHCKQQERELKRVEGDVLKEERNLKKAMKEYEKGLNLLVKNNVMNLTFMTMFI